MLPMARACACPRSRNLKVDDIDSTRTLVEPECIVVTGTVGGAGERGRELDFSAQRKGLRQERQSDGARPLISSRSVEHLTRLVCVCMAGAVLPSRGEPSGRVDSSTSPKLGRVMHAIIDRGDINIVVDMTALEYISSTGLSGFLSSAKKIRAAGGRIALCGLNSRIRLAFEMSGFLRLFPVFLNVDAAIAG